MKKGTERDINAIVGDNIKLYIEAIGKSQKWVYEKADISKGSFYKLLKGEGDLNRTIPKLNKLFRIQNPFYFYEENFIPPKTIQTIKKGATIQQQMAASYHGDADNPEFQETITMLEDFISMIDTLETLKEIAAE